MLGFRFFTRGLRGGQRAIFRGDGFILGTGKGELIVNSIAHPKSVRTATVDPRKLPWARVGCFRLW